MFFLASFNKHLLNSCTVPDTGQRLAHNVVMVFNGLSVFLPAWFSVVQHSDFPFGSYPSLTCSSSDSLGLLLELLRKWCFFSTKDDQLVKRSPGPAEGCLFHLTGGQCLRIKIGQTAER